MDKNIDYYFTIKDVQRAEIKIKSSKFIATVSSVNSLDNAIDFLSKIRAEFFDATHNCFAYRIGWDGSTFRASDDGEPSGSAGKPILFSIQKFDVSDVIVVVTRYFGGTKLGVGGLVRAYSDAAELALEKCEKQIINRTKSVKINCRYEEISRIQRLIEPWAVSFEETYSEAVVIIANIHISKVEQFAATVKTATNAKVKVTIL